MMFFAEIKRLFANKDFKQLVENFFSLSVLRVFNLVLPFVTLPYLIGTLGFERYGVIILALALVQYFQAVTDYGFNLSATREIARHRHSNHQLSVIYSKVMTAKVLLLIVSMLLILPVIFLVPQFRADRVIFLLMLPILIGHTLFPEWFFRGVEKMRYITILDLSIKLFFTVGVFSFINHPDDYWVYPLLNGLGYCVVALLSHYIVSNHFAVRVFFVRISKIKYTLIDGLPLFVNQFAPNLYNNTANLVVGLVMGNYAAGVFGAVRQVVSLLSVFNSVVTAVVFPYLSRNKGGFGIFSRYYFAVSLLLILAAVLLKSFLFSFFNVDDDFPSQFYYVLVLGVLFTVVYSVYATSYLLTYNLDNEVLRLTLISSVTGFFIVYPLVVTYGLMGAALAIAVSQSILGVLSFVAYKKHSRRG